MSSSSDSSTPSIKATDLFSSWAESGRDEKMEIGHMAPVNDMLHRVAPLLPNAPFRFLDVGCGNGWVSRKLAASGMVSAAVGVDGAASMIEKAQRLSVDVPKTSFVHSDLASFSPEEPFDVVFSMEVLYYLKPNEVTHVLERIRNDWLRPGGLFVFGIDHYYENEACHDWAELNSTYMLLWTKEEWQQALEAAGLEVVESFKAAEGVEWEGGTLAFVARA